MLTCSEIVLVPCDGLWFDDVREFVLRVNATKHKTIFHFCVTRLSDGPLLKRKHDFQLVCRMMETKALLTKWYPKVHLLLCREIEIYSSWVNSFVITEEKSSLILISRVCAEIAYWIYSRVVFFQFLHCWRSKVKSIVIILD